MVLISRALAQLVHNLEVKLTLEVGLETINRPGPAKQVDLPNVCKTLHYLFSKFVCGSVERDRVVEKRKYKKGYEEIKN